MNEMVERVAQAMLDKLKADDDSLAYWAMPAYFHLKAPMLATEEQLEAMRRWAEESGGWDAAKRDAMKLSEVAIAAMREPTQAMENAGNDYDCTPLAVDVWRDMIDAALK